MNEEEKINVITGAMENRADLERKRIEALIVNMLHNHKGFGCEHDKALKELLKKI